MRDDLSQSIKDFDHTQNHLDEYYAPLKAAQKRVAELRAALADAEAEVATLEAHGSPRDGFWKFINECEARLSGIARQLLDRFCQDAARSTFKVAFERLTEHTQKDIALIYRLRLERFTNAFYARLRRQEGATGNQIKARASELLRDLETIESENLK